MYSIVRGLGAAVFLWGCSADHGQEKLMRQHHARQQYHQQMLKTEKIQFLENGQTRVMLTALYLNRNNPEKRSTEDEQFVVGIYAEESPAPLATHLLLEGIKPKHVTLLDDDDPRLRTVSFKTAWSRFYLVSYPHTPKERFSLVYTDSRCGKGVLHFAKRAKYTFDPRIF